MFAPARLGKFKAAGTLYVTTYRMVFAAKKPTTQNSIEFKGFDIPIKNIEKESFNQPIFGCNNHQITGDLEFHDHLCTYILTRQFASMNTNSITSRSTAPLV